MIEKTKHKINLIIKSIESNIATFKQSIAIKKAFDGSSSSRLNLTTEFKKISRGFNSTVSTVVKSLVSFKGFSKRISDKLLKLKEESVNLAVEIKDSFIYSVKSTKKYALKGAITIFSVLIIIAIAQTIKKLSSTKQIDTPTNSKKVKVLKKITVNNDHKIKKIPIKSEKKSIVKTLKKTEPEDTIKKEYIINIMKSELFLGKKYILVASKKEKELLVLKNNNNGSFGLVEKYVASFGKLQGDKKREGDLRTPEGIYKIVKRKSKRELSEIFGPMAFVLNYPNDLDKKSGKTGSNIWIHGTGMNEVTPDTKGCVEISDPDIINLSKYIDGNSETPIVIFPDTYKIADKLTDNKLNESFIKNALSKEAKI